MADTNTWADMSDDDWADLEDQWVDDTDDDTPPPIPNAADANLDAVSRMMGAMRRIGASIAEYDRLDAIERRRLDTQRERAIGPQLRRLAHLDGVVIDFATKAFVDFGKTRHATPNGSITSNATKPAVVVDDNVAGQFFESTARVDLVARKLKVPVDALRKWLDQSELNGELVRCIVIKDHGITELDLPPGHVYRFPFADNETGRWRIPGGADCDCDTPVAEAVMGAPVAHQLGCAIFNDRYVPGVSWTPSGTGATGRNFHVKPA